MGLFDRVVNSKIMDTVFSRGLERYLTKAQSKKPGVLRYQVSPMENARSVYSKQKPGTGIPFPVLRRFSTQHEISRAAINARKRQISSLEWDVVPTDPEDKNDYSNEITEIERWFKEIGGSQNRYRKFMDKAIEDLLVLDALALYKEKTLGGELMNLLPIDATTIRLQVEPSGKLPDPPGIAYKQVIRGSVVAELTTEEMIYEMLNPRTNSPYGLAPLESLILTVSASLQAATYNLDYLGEGNVPEGFFKVPETWSPKTINEFQENWDAMIAGDTTQTSKLRFVPGGQGVGYEPTKKMSDMAWKEFNEWLTHVTCSVFDISPREIGFEPKGGGLGGKGFEEGQEGLAQRRGIYPLALFFQEVFDGVIQVDMDKPHLRFKFLGLDVRDEKREAEVAEIEIRSGQRTINETRKDQGLEPHPDKSADRPMILTGFPTFIDDETVQEKKDTAAALADKLSNKPDNQGDNEGKKAGDEEANRQASQKGAESRHIALVHEIRRFRRQAVRRKRDGRRHRDFRSEIIPADDLAEMNKRVSVAKDREAIGEVFDEFARDYQTQFLQDALQLKTDLRKVLGDGSAQPTAKG